MVKVPRQSYTAEFKLATVQRVKDGQGVARGGPRAEHF